MAGRVLLITNDFPTRTGGIEVFVRRLCDEFPPDRIVVRTARMPGAAGYDRGCRFPVVRDPAATLLPTPAATRRAVSTLRSYDCDRVLFGAAAPLGLMAPALRAAGARRIVGLTHGHEAWWATTIGARTALRRIGAGCDALGYVSQWARDRIAPALDDHAAAAMIRVAPGVDTAAFRPDCGGARLRQRWGLDAVPAPVVGCVARLVKRKGQDTLLRAWPRVRLAAPDAVLVLAGDGPDRDRLGRLAAELDLGDAVLFAGALSHADVPAVLDSFDVFAMPCRTRWLGREAEALGFVCLEAAACETPVLVGDSGGAPETVRHRETGVVVDPGSPVAVATALIDLLVDRARAAAMGRAGRAWVSSEWTWQRAGDRLRRLLDVPG